MSKLWCKTPFINLISLQSWIHKPPTWTMRNDEFKVRLERIQERCHQTGLPWKANHPLHLTGKNACVCRLKTLVKKLEKSGTNTDYDEVMNDDYNDVKRMVHSAKTSDMRESWKCRTSDSVWCISGSARWCQVTERMFEHWATTTEPTLECSCKRTF